MNKIHLIFSIIILSGISVFHSSCEDDNKEEYLTPTSIYFVKEGVQELKMYNKGAGTSYTYKLDLYRSGLLGGEVSAQIEVLTADELTDFNIDNDTHYEMLDSDVYSIEKMGVTFSGDQKDVNQLINISFDPAKLDQSEVNKVLPIKIKSATVDINKSKSVCIIHPVSVKPTIALQSPQMEIINYEKGVSSVLSKEISAILDIDLNEWDIDVELELDTDYLNAYNQENNENYILPGDDMYSLETTKTIEKGKTTLSFSLNIFQRYLDGNYMLPIRLKTSSKFDVAKEEHFIIILNNVKVIPKGSWTIAGFSSEEATGESGGAQGKAIYLIDGNKNTFWHSQWSGSTKAPLPHHVIVDLGTSYTILQVDLIQRQTSIAETTAKTGEFYVSDDKISWTKIGDYTGLQNHDTQSFSVSKKMRGRYFKVVITTSYAWDGTASLAEVSLRGY